MIFLVSPSLYDFGIINVCQMDDRFIVNVAEMTDFDTVFTGLVLIAIIRPIVLTVPEFSSGGLAWEEDRRFIIAEE